MTDVAAGSYYEKAVAWAIENGVTNGTGSGAFSPDATCTRAQAVTFLARALNAKAEGSAAFSDVPADSYYADAVAWAVASGVTDGVGNGLFAPGNDCTRTDRNRKSKQRLDRHETIVAERCETFRYYCIVGVSG